MADTKRQPITPGMRFSRLTVVEQVPKTAPGINLWLTVCDCGTRTVVTSSRLRGGYTKSCGCLRRHINKATAAKNFAKRRGGNGWVVKAPLFVDGDGEDEWRDM